MTKYAKVSLPDNGGEKTALLNFVKNTLQPTRRTTARMVRPVPTNGEGKEPIFDLGPNPNSKHAALVLDTSAFEASDVENFLVRGKTFYTPPGKAEAVAHPDESIVRIGGDYPVPLVARFQYKELPGSNKSDKMRFFIFFNKNGQEGLEVLEEKLGFKLITSPQAVDQTTALALTTLRIPVPKPKLQGIWFFIPNFSEDNGMVWKYLKPGDTCYINFGVKIPPGSSEAFTVIKKIVKVDKRELSAKYKPSAFEESIY